jgi:hypothetical protein
LLTQPTLLAAGGLRFATLATVICLSMQWRGLPVAMIYWRDRVLVVKLVDCLDCLAQPLALLDQWKRSQCLH